MSYKQDYENGGSSIADMIRRFREAKPTSRNERQDMKKNGNLSQMWWEKSGEASSSSILEDDMDPRALAIGPQVKSTKPPSSEIFDYHNKPDDYVTRRNNSKNTNTLLNSSVRSSLDQSFNLDTLIEKEIKSLANGLKMRTNEISNRFSLESYGPDYGNRNPLNTSLDRSPNRHRIGNRSSRDLMSSNNFNDTRVSFLNQSVETLGSTGFKGLLVPELKLDGKNNQPKNGDEDNMKNLNVNLDELLKSLNEGKKQASYLPDGIEETIPQITNKLTTQMMEFQNLFGNKFKEEDELEKEAKIRDNNMKEEGRKEERAKKLLDIDLPIEQPLEYFIEMNKNQQSTGPLRQSRMDFILADNRSKASVIDKIINDNGGIEIINNNRFSNKNKNIRTDIQEDIIQSVINNEVNSADEVVSKMRNLRYGLAEKMKKIDYLNSHLSTNNLDGQQYYRANDIIRINNHEYKVIRSHSSPPSRENLNIRNSFQYNYNRNWAFDDTNYVRFAENDDEIEDVRKIWNPYPNLVHENIFSVSKGIKSIMDVTMETLNARLPPTKEEIPVPNKPVEFSILTPNAIIAIENKTKISEETKSSSNSYNNIPNDFKDIIDNFDKQLLDKSSGMSEEKIKELKNTINLMRQLLDVSPVINNKINKDEKSIENKNSIEASVFNNNNNNNNNNNDKHHTSISQTTTPNNYKATIPIQSVQKSIASSITSDTIKAAVSAVASKSANNNTNKTIKEQLNDLDNVLGVEKPREIMGLDQFISADSDLSYLNMNKISSKSLPWDTRNNYNKNNYKIVNAPSDVDLLNKDQQFVSAPPIALNNVSSGRNNFYYSKNDSEPLPYRRPIEGSSTRHLRLNSNENDQPNNINYSTSEINNSYSNNNRTFYFNNIANFDSTNVYQNYENKLSLIPSSNHSMKEKKKYLENSKKMRQNLMTGVEAII